jgi:hypothetical protein
MRDKLPLSAPTCEASACRVMLSSLRRLRIDKPNDIIFSLLKLQIKHKCILNLLFTQYFYVLFWVAATMLQD